MNGFKRAGLRLSAALLALILCAALCLPAFAAEDAAGEIDRAAELMEISDILTYFSMDYQDSEISMLHDMLAEMLRRDPALYQEMIEYMFGKLDDYSRYLTNEEYDLLYPRGEPYVGVGMVADTGYPFGLVVGSLIEGGPAAEAGLLPGDVVVRVDGSDVEFLPFYETVPLIRGDDGTAVVLEVRRAGAGGLLSFKIERRSIMVSNVSYQNMGGGVGLITVSRFDSMADIFDYTDIYNNIPYDDDIKSVIIDLRDNPGGDVAVMFNMLNQTLTDKMLLFTMTTGLEHGPYITDGLGAWTPNETIILVNENSASASEIFAGSLQTHGLAKLVGVKTRGKGRSQYHVPAANGVVIVTVYDILLPDGLPYDGVGIILDVTVEQEVGVYGLPELPPLDIAREIKYGTSSVRVAALQHRLAALGILPGGVGGRYDDTTRWSVNVLQKYCGLPISENADTETLEKLEELLAELSGETVIYDRQLEAALEMAYEAAANPRPAPLSPR
ncbi:MAG: S41 family peptidase [Oscillospiraceae bacterium]|nr:S41 family peptidase [Oscillospiraceae bacterium]